MGVEVTNTLVMPKDVIDRLKSYVKTEEEPNQESSGHTRQSLQKLIEMENDINNQDWTPCRWSSIGWKYQKKGTFNKFLNPTFKINATGGRGPPQTEDQLKTNYFPSARPSLKQQSPEATQNEEE